MIICSHDFSIFPAPGAVTPSSENLADGVPLRRSSRGFTILEMLTAMAVLAMLAVLILSIMSQTSQAVRTSNDRVESFQSAREGFDSLTKQLGQATLNTYYDYFDAGRNARTASNSSTFTPAIYGRQSDLHFLSGYADNAMKSLVPSGWNPVTQAVFFQTPMGYALNGSYNGMESLLNACGFFVAYTSDSSERPSQLTSSQASLMSDQYRFRLYRMSQPTESLKVYADTVAANQKDWFQKPLQSSAGNVAVARQNGIYPIADNVIALVVWPKYPSTQEAKKALASKFNYDSKSPWDGGNQVTWSAGDQPAQMNQLPPLLDVAMVTIDESSAKRLLKGISDPTSAMAALGITLSDKFADSQQIDSDLAKLQSQLITKGIKCRIFRTTISIRGSKWSNANS